MTRPNRGMKGVAGDTDRSVKRCGRGVFFGLLVVLCASVVFAGCVNEPGEPTTPENPPSILVDYVRTGGIAGVSDHLVVFENGQAIYSTWTGSGEFELSSGDVDRLRDVFAIAGFESLNGTYPAPTPGADYFTYRITYENQTVITQTTGVPDQLMPVISYLDQIITAQSAR
ncbi:hypothetical protein J2741_000997 [Methanolinea mesophila]|uniref:hypothetical protein n=1 Tax=Methanolinea mesophila TaxID=547055 RepID=UPI001AE70A4A|nr:hypothetical protein [Methanolinea mesophila]MBP1928450.1 hypothetical protein [Methanolinea mesophila]